MRHRAPLVVAIGLALVSVVLPGALASHSAAPAGPITNGEFQTRVPNAPFSLLDGTPADRCFGVGHQVLFGEDTPQGTATGGAWDDTDTTEADPGQAVSDVASDPQGEAQQQTQCFSNNQEGFDLAWINPSELGGGAVGWSTPDDVKFGDFDNNGDREAKVPANDSASNHNLWQVTPGGNRHAAYSGNFHSLQMKVEQGVPISTDVDARFYLHFSTTPLATQDEEAVIFIDCSLRIPLGGEVGRVSLSPVSDDVEFVDRGGDECDDIASTWPDASKEQRREDLAHLSIVQLGFRNLNQGSQPAIIDDVRLKGASLLAEEAARGNVFLNPDVDV